MRDSVFVYHEAAVETNQEESTEKLILPQSLLVIGEEAFLNIPAKKIEIPNSVNSIGQNAFSKGAILILHQPGYAAEWAEANGYSFSIE